MYDNWWQWVLGQLSTLISWINNVDNKLATAINSIQNTIYSWVMGVIASVKTEFSTVAEQIRLENRTGWSAITGWVSGTIKAVENTIASTATSFQGMLNSVYSTLRTQFSSEIANLKKVMEAITPYLKAYIEANTDLLKKWALERFEEVEEKGKAERKWLEERKLDFISFFTNPVEFIWQRFTTWFFGG